MFVAYAVCCSLRVSLRGLDGQRAASPGTVASTAGRSGRGVGQIPSLQRFGLAAKDSTHGEVAKTGILAKKSPGIFVCLKNANIL